MSSYSLLVFGRSISMATYRQHFAPHSRHGGVSYEFGDFFLVIRPPFMFSKNHYTD